MKNNKKKFILFLKGMIMGIADIIPGISGGTIAFITNIYEDLINSINAFDLYSLKLLIKGKIKKFWIHINGSFLFLIFFGILTSLVTFSNITSYLITNHPIQLWSFFFGIIIISLFEIYKKIKNNNFIKIFYIFMGFIIGYIVIEIIPSSTNNNFLFIFFSGSIAVSAMILPGISGSFILLILGKYEFMINALKNLNFFILFTFGLGCLFGLIIFSKIIKYLLTKKNNFIISILIGFMIGSLNKIWPWKITLIYKLNKKGIQTPILQKNTSPFIFKKIIKKNPLILESILYFILGFFLMIIILRISKKKILNNKNLT